jgi:Fe-S cluster biosynthesis and repair protein YggX
MTVNYCHHFTKTVAGQQFLVYGQQLYNIIYANKGKKATRKGQNNLVNASKKSKRKISER